jgi:hypothetical protein
MRLGFYIGVNMKGVALFASRIYLALDASAVLAAEVAERASGHRLKALVREPLAAGALEPGAAGANLHDAEAVRGAIARALAPLGDSRVTLVLPDGVARLALVEPPRGTPAREYVRFRLAPSLPWPAEQAGFDALDAGHGRAVGAAVRRATVAEYEQAARAVGAGVEQVHLAPLLALAGLLRGRGGEGAHAVLGDVAMCLGLVSEGALVALRSRRRDRSPGEAARLGNELRRLGARLAGGNGQVPLRVSGSDAARLAGELGAALWPERAAPAGAGADGAGAAWLTGLLS